MVAPIIIAVAAVAASAAASELIKGPLQQALGGVFPHQDVAVRSMAAMYVAGGINRDDFLKTDAISHLVESDRKVVVEYADYMRNLKEKAMADAANKGVAKVLNDLNSEYDKLVNTSYDIELDTYTNEINTQIANVEVEKKPYESLFYSAAKRGEQQPFIDALKSFNGLIGSLKQNIQDKRTDIMNRRKQDLDILLNSLQPVEKITDLTTAVSFANVNPFAVPTVETLTEVCLNIMSSEKITPTGAYLLQKAGFPVNQSNVLIANSAILEAEKINPINITTFAGPYEFVQHYIINGADVYQVKNLSSGTVEYLSKQAYDAVSAAGKVTIPSGTAVTPTALIDVSKLTAEQQAALAAIANATIITAEMMQSLQPYLTPVVVTNPNVPNWSITERPDGTWTNHVNGHSGDYVTCIMQMRDDLRMGGQAKANVTVTYKNGSRAFIIVEA